MPLFGPFGDRNLLSQIVHASEEAQHVLLKIELCDSLVRARVAGIYRIALFRLKDPKSLSQEP
jgi:hypothetical protein